MGLIQRLNPFHKIRELERVVAAQSDRIFRKEHASGVDMTSGRFTIEANEELTGTKKWDTLDEMENDPHIKGALQAIVGPMMNATPEIKAASEDAQDIEIAEFCAANLLRETNDNYGREVWCQSSWRQRLQEHARCFRDGFSMSAFTMRREGSKVVYDRIHWLEPSSVDPMGWVLDGSDNLERIERTYSDAQRFRQGFKYQETLPIEQVILFVHEMVGARYEGRPLIRSMYGAWLRKVFMQRHQAIRMQKFAGGGPPLGIYPAGWTDQEMLDEFESAVKGNRGQADAEMWHMFPTDEHGNKPSIEWPGMSSAGADITTAPIASENLEIGHGGQSLSESTTENGVGSHASASTKAHREMDQVQGLARAFEDQYNHGVGNIPGIIERLVDHNWSGVTSYPELVLSRISADEGLEHYGEQVEAWKNGIIPKTPEARKQIVVPLGIELPEEQFDVEEPAPMLPPGAAPDDPEDEGSEDEDGEVSSGEDRAAAVQLAAFKDRIGDMLKPMEGAPTGGRFRAPNRLETEVVNLAEVSEAFRIGERDIMSVLRTTSTAMKAELMGRLRAGKITTRNLGSQRRSAFKGTRKASRALTRAVSRTAAVGIVHVERELEVQGDG